MSSLLKVSKPCAGVCIASREASTLVAALVERGDKSTTRIERRSISYASTTAMPDEASLKSAVGSIFTQRGALSAAISVPDILVKTSILEFDELPALPKEAAGVVAWKAAKGLFLKPTEVNVGYERFSLDSGRIEVLASAVSKDYADFLEDAFFAEGVAVSSISTHAFDIYNAVRSRLSTEQNFAFIVKWPSYFSFVGFSGGVPCFFRCKEYDGAESFLMEVETSLTHCGVKCTGGSVERVYCMGEGMEGLIADLKGKAVILEASELLPAHVKAENKTDAMYALAAIGAVLY